MSKDDFMNDNSYYDKYCRLKYLYFINPDTILPNIINAEEVKNLSINLDSADFIDQLFYNIFSKLWSSPLFYNKFLWKSNSFFQNLLEYDDRAIVNELFKQCFFYHCIIHGFFEMLHITNGNDNHPYLKISSKNDSLSRIGYFYSKENTDATYLYPNENFSKNLSQQYNKWGKSGKQDYYSHIILQSLNSEKTLSSNYYNVPNYLKNLGYFLFSQQSVRNVDKNLKLSKKTRLVNNYISLFDHTQSILTDSNNYNSCIQLENNPDRLLFSVPMEYCYGFTSLNSILPFLNVLHNNSIDNDTFGNIESNNKSSSGKIAVNKVNSKYLENNQLYYTIGNLFECPLIYSRHFFWKYSCRAILSSRILSSAYLDNDPAAVVDRISGKIVSGKITLTELGIPLILKFFSTLNTLTIPVIEYFWDVCMRKIQIEHNISDETLLSCYCKIIEQNYNCMKFDFSCLFDNTKNSSLFSPKLRQQLLNDIKKSHNDFMQSLNGLISSDLFSQSNNFSKPNANSKRILTDILFDKLNTDTLCHKLSIDELWYNEIPICNLCDLPNRNDMLAPEIEQFYTTHRNNLIDFFYFKSHYNE